MRFIINILAAVILIVIPSNAASYKESELRILLGKAMKHAEAMEYDSAMNVYNKVVRLYDPKMLANDKRLCLEAIYGCFDINIKNGFYNGAVNDLSLAEDIAKELNYGLSKLHARYAQLYVVMLTQTRKDKYLKMIEERAHEAFRTGMEEGDFESASTGYSNLLIVYYHNHDPQIIEKETNTLRGLKQDWKIKSLLLDYEHTKASIEGNYDKAAQYLDTLISIIPQQSDTYRLRVSTLRDKAIALGYGGHYAEAINILKDVINKAYKNNLRDQRLGALCACAIFSEEMGDSVAAEEYNNRALALRDSLSAYNISDDIVELEYIKEHRELQQSIDKARSDHKIMRIGLIGLTAIVLTVIIFLVVLKRKNSILSHRAMLLRDRIQELYTNNSRASWATANLNVTSASEEIEDNESEEDNAETKSEAGTTKYESSNLSVEEKHQIAADIEKAAESDIVFNPDFSLNMLAEAVGRHPKVVSQVINEVFSVNFSTYINRIRIVEACRMFDNPQYANWSVEGIAEAVGIKSRSSFSSNFKKITGMNIKEYRKNVQNHDLGHK